MLLRRDVQEERGLDGSFYFYFFYLNILLADDMGLLLDQVVSFEVGHFRTPVLSKSQMKVEVGAVAGMEDYKPLVRGWMERSGGMSGNQVCHVFSVLPIHHLLSFPFT